MNSTQEIYASRQSNKILTGTLSAIEKYENSECGVVFSDPYKVLIPKEEMGINNYAILRSMVGAEIDYIVEGIDADNNIAVGSRLKAMELRRKMEFPHLKAGSTILVRIDAVGANNIYAEVYGTEVKIPKEDAVWGFVRSLNEVFSVGDKVPAVIKAIDHDAGTIEVSIKDAQEDPFKAALNKYRVRGEYMGTVTGTEDYGIFVELERGVSALCPFPVWKNINITPGDKVLVRIQKIDGDKRKIKGVLTRLVRKGY